MSTYDVSQWVLFAISILAEYWIIKKNVLGFYLWIVLCIGWFTIDYIAGLYGQATSYVFFLLVCIYGAIEWRVKQ